MEKKPVKINLSTAILVIVIILLLALISFLIFRNNELKDKARNIADTSNVLNEKIDISDNNSKVEKNDSKNQLVSSNMSEQKVGKVKDYETNNTNTQNTTSEILNTKQIKYKEIKKELNGSDVLDVTDVIKNSKGTYTLKGKISVVDTSKREEAEYPPRKYSGEYMQITVSGDTKCVYSVDSYDEKTSTVEEVFSKKLAFGNCFNFKFKDDKCISVYEVVVGH